MNCKGPEDENRCGRSRTKRKKEVKESFIKEV